MQTAKKRSIIDAHVHLYDHRQNRHEFLERDDPMFQALVGDYSSLPKNYGLHDYLAASPELKLEGLIWTEFLSADPVQEVRWAQRLANTMPVPTALIGLVDFLDPDLERRLQIYADCPNVAGVREHLGWDATNPLRRFAKRPDLLTDTRWLQGLALLARHRFTCSLEVFAPQLPALEAVVRSHPGIHFTIAVMGWPLSTDRAGFAAWKRDMAALSECPNVRVVISAIECIFGMHWTISQVQPWIEPLIDLFGPYRIMFGSHRPICGLCSTYPEPYRAYEAMVAGLSDSEQDAVFRSNAAEWFFPSIDTSIHKSR